MLVQHLLLETLEDLCDDDFTLFKWYLSQPLLSGCEPIAKSHLQSPARHDTVSRMIDCYNETPAVDITVEALKKMKHNNAAQQLKKTYTEGSAAEQNPGPTPHTSSALQQPRITVSAQGRSVVITPIVNSNTFGGPVFMNITKNN